LTAVHQFVPALVARDAIGAHTLQVQRVLRELGYASDLFVDHTDLTGRADVHPYRQFDEHSRDPDTFLLYQGSTGSPMARFVAERSEPTIVNYHNITPPEFFEPWEPSVTMVLEAGYRQIEELGPGTVLGIADSEYNAGELRRLGYGATAVVPILYDPGNHDAAPDPATLHRLEAEKAGGGSDWLFVGRLCPNKAQHDLVKAFAAYRVAFDPRARLHLVGGSSSHLYETCLQAFAHEIGVGDAVRFAGSVTPGELSAHYRVADVFVCLSRHEGFGVPLLEAMHHDVPIVALRATAVPETVGDAGVLVPASTPALVAAAVERVRADADLRAALQAAGRRRLEHFDQVAGRERFAAAIRDVCGAP